MHTLSARTVEREFRVAYHRSHEMETNRFALECGGMTPLSVLRQSSVMSSDARVAAGLVRHV